MYSETGRSNHDTQGIDNSEKVEETVVLENLLELKETVSPEKVKELSTIGTQTPLTLIKVTVTSSSVRRQFIDSAATPTRFSSVTVHDYFHGSRENTPATLSREVTTQATPPHPLLMPRSSRDTLQMSASFSSFKSDQRNEVLTVTTDYGIPSPNAINESDAGHVARCRTA
ncbi:uncharacterized protein LOC116427193 [Nomia melanderi]|uniref:uncharacterized protein LOC116427193 n=1 Tax=Nomia melanderi TaxID=2448451 RepID=UPI003FCED7DB